MFLSLIILLLPSGLCANSATSFLLFRGRRMPSGYLPQMCLWFPSPCNSSQTQENLSRPFLSLEVKSKLPCSSEATLAHLPCLSPKLSKILSWAQEISLLPLLREKVFTVLCPARGDGSPEPGIQTASDIFHNCYAVK